MKKKKLILFGYKEFGEIAYEYFTHDSEYKVVGFCANKDYIDTNEKYGLPVVPFEEIEKIFPPNDHSLHVACVYNKLNRLRTEIIQIAKLKGYDLASYISSRSFVWKNVKLGEHVFIFEDNTIQPFVNIGNNVILWSGNHIGHHSTIDDNCFVSSHVVISGGVYIGKNCFLGVNATINNAISIENDCFLASGALITKNIPENTLVKGLGKISNTTPKQYFNI